MHTANSPIDLPILRVDSAVWERGEGHDDSHLTARLTLGDLTVRLEAMALDRAGRDPAYETPYAQHTRIGERSYLVVGFRDHARAALAAAV